MVEFPVRHVLGSHTHRSIAVGKMSLDALCISKGLYCRINVKFAMTATHPENKTFSDVVLLTINKPNLLKHELKLSSKYLFSKMCWCISQPGLFFGGLQVLIALFCCLHCSENLLPGFSLSLRTDLKYHYSMFLLFFKYFKCLFSPARKSLCKPGDLFPLSFAPMAQPHTLPPQPLEGN